MNKAMDAQVMSKIIGHGSVVLESSSFELEELSFSEAEDFAVEADKTTIRVNSVSYNEFNPHIKNTERIRLCR